MNNAYAFCLVSYHRKIDREYHFVMHIMQYHFLRPSQEQQDKIQSCIRFVKAGELNTAGEVIKSVIQELWRERDVPVTMGCTELPLAYEASGLPLERQVSSLKALSDACIRVLYEV